MFGMILFEVTLFDEILLDIRLLQRIILYKNLFDVIMYELTNRFLV